MKTVIGIDVGGSTTKIVGFSDDGEKKVLIEPLFVSATDPLTSAYGAFGKFIDQNGIELQDIEKVLMTGVGSSHLKREMYGLPTVSVPEFDSIGKGGLYLSGLDNCLVVSMGTGTAIVHAKRDKIEYLGGTGVGGGSLIGLSKLMIGAETVEHIVDLASGGDLSKIDLRIGDISVAKLGSVPSELTAANFGNVSDIAERVDIAKGIMNLVYETIGMCAIFAARSRGVQEIVLTGNLTQFDFCREKFEDFNRMYDGIHFSIPRLAQFATVIGTALSSEIKA
jgi:type II pantothenate kinase